MERKTRKKFDREWESAINSIPRYDGYWLRKTILEYQSTGVEPTQFASNIVRALFVVIKPVIDRRRKAVEAQRRRRERMRVRKAVTKDNDKAPNTVQSTIGKAVTGDVDCPDICALYAPYAKGEEYIEKSGEPIGRSPNADIVAAYPG